ncbi:protein phosphatase 2C 51-like [Cornus florida]|uniref:protein phosphatase 2C 51-like n=1 Tax=Cornus florida TaxID=4283 RepID=UPI0028A25538|nr:protein phosphatase 2C 51-like [Cornus florida]
MTKQLGVRRAMNARRRRFKVRRLKSSTNPDFAVAGDPGNVPGDDRCFEKRRFHDEGVESDEVKRGDPLEMQALVMSLSFSSSSASSSDHSPESDAIPGGASSSSDRESSRRVTCVSNGSVSIIGGRREMEDAVRSELGFLTMDSRNYDFYGVYDGHGGSGVARGCRDRLHQLVLAEIEGGEAVSAMEVDWEKVMIASFGKMDEEVFGSESGSTAVVAVVGEEELVVANCGDSRAVLSRGGVALPMSTDHKPDRPDELERIEAAGGRVINWYGQRVSGVLATSRSIGDDCLKPFVISEPEVRVCKRTDADEFLILASDGLWDVVSNDVACQVVRRCLNGQMKRRTQETVSRRESSATVRKSPSAEGAQALAKLAVSRGSNDNISVIVVELKKPGRCTTMPKG